MPCLKYVGWVLLWCEIKSLLLVRLSAGVDIRRCRPQNRVLICRHLSIYYASVVHLASFVSCWILHCDTSVFISLGLVRFRSEHDTVPKQSRCPCYNPFWTRCWIIKYEITLRKMVIVLAFIGLFKGALWTLSPFFRSPKRQNIARFI